MPIDERSRHHLYLKLEQVLGTEEATTLMEHLPPVGWADVATKHDLAQLEERMGLRLDAGLHSLEARLLAQMSEQTRTLYRTLMVANAASILAVAGLAFAAARLV